MKKIHKILLMICICLVPFQSTFAQTIAPPTSLNVEKVLHDFEDALTKEKIKMPALYNSICSVKVNLDNLENFIRTELQPLKGMQIDFIPQYELAHGAEIDPWVHDSIENYQRKVRDFLLKEGYDLVGWECSSLDSITPETYKKELIERWKEDDPSVRIDATNLFERYLTANMWQDGVLAYWAMNPKTRLTGIQETTTWILNFKANQFDPLFSEYVARFRSYLAMAKILKAIHETKATHPVIVMGAWHKYDLILIANLLVIKINIVNVELN